MKLDRIISFRQYSPQRMCNLPYPKIYATKKTMKSVLSEKNRDENVPNAYREHLLIVWLVSSAYTDTVKTEHD